MIKCSRFLALALASLFGLASATSLSAQDAQVPAADMQAMHLQMMGYPRPTLSGQDAFGAIQEIVKILEANPKTDWSKVNLEALRRHLIDMNDVTLHANADATPIEGGVKIAITGEGRTKDAIQRMVTAHAHEVDSSHLNGWSATADPIPTGVVLTVTSADPREATHIRGLGFVGILTSGPHHQPHHLAMALGQMVH